MSEPNPWESISPPANADFTVVRVADTSGIPVYWGRDGASQCLMILDLEGDFTDQFRKDYLSLHGINIDLRNGDESGHQRLVLTLARDIDSDLFLGLCETVINSLRAIKDSRTALAVTLAHLKRWKAFLAGNTAKRLSAEEIRGLFAELHVMRRIYQQTISKSAAVDAWCGPDKSHQDFIFGNRAIEVKSLSGRNRSTVRISSEDQLESVCEKLYLLTVRLIDVPDSEKAMSLNGIVSLIESELNDASAVEQFSTKLVGLGYVPLIDYDLPLFSVGPTQGYRVTESFPKLVRSQLPVGVTNLVYDLALEAIEPFLCDANDLLGRC